MNDFWIRLNGSSMFPLLQDQNEILITATKYENLKLGDVILFIDGNSHELTVHRLAKLPMITKGDNSRYMESNSKESYLGKAIYFKDKNGVYPICSSKYLLKISLMRSSENMIIRRMSFFCLLVISIFLKLYNAKTKLSHSKTRLVNDLSSRV